MIIALVALASILVGLAIVAVIIGCILVSQQADLKAYIRTAIDLLQQLVRNTKPAIDIQSRLPK